MSVPWLVVSPHCDDAVFSCGALLARHPGSVIVTVFAGSPPAYEPFTEWDWSSGFVPGQDVMALRRAEDARAAGMLRARAVWLPFLDSQYGASPGVDAVAAALAREIETHRPRAVAFPLGLFHSDHVLAREAMLTLAGDRRLPRLVAYVDALYRRLADGVEAALRALRERGWSGAPCEFASDAEDHTRKRAAIACYVSQLRALATPGRLGHADAYAPERYVELVAVAQTT